MKKIIYIWFIITLFFPSHEIKPTTTIFPDINYVQVPDSTAAYKFMQIADSLYEAGNDQESIRNYSLAIEGYEKIGNWENVIYCTVQLGDSFRRIDELIEARASFQKAIEIANQKLKNNHPLLIFSLLGLIKLNIDLGNYEIAVNQSYEVINLCNFNCNSTIYPIKMYLAETNHLLGIVYIENGKYEEALENINNALNIYQSNYNEIDFRIGKYLNSIAVVYAEMGDFDRALENYEKSISIFKNYGGESNLFRALAYQNMAIILGDYKGDYTEALKYYDAAIRIILDVYGEHHSFAALVYYNLGSLYEKQFDFKKALFNYNKSLNIYESLYGIEHTNVAMCHRSIGDIYKELDDYPHSYDYYSIAVSIQLRLFGIGHTEVAKTYNSMGELNRFQNRFEHAMGFHKEALEIFKNNYGKLHPEISKTYNLIGLMYASQNKQEEALKNFQKSIVSNIPQYSNLDSRSNLNIDDVISEPFLLQSLSYKIESLVKQFENTNDLNYLVSAFNVYKTAIELVEKMKISYRAEESKQFLAQNSSTLYEDAINLSLKLFRETNDLLYKDQAYLFSQKSKAGILLDAMNKSRAKKFADIPDSLLYKERELKISLTRYENQIHYFGYSDQQIDGNKIAETKDQLFSLNREYTSLLDQFEKDYPRYHSAKYHTEEVDTRSILQVLNDDTCLIEYFVGKSHIYAFYFDKDRYEVFTIDHNSRFSELLHSYYSSIKKINNEQYLSSAYDLYKLLIAPMENVLRGKKELIIIPDGDLHYLPFESLLSKNNLNENTDFADLDYLMKRFIISYIYSSSFLTNNTLVTNSTTSTDGLIGFAPIFAKADSMGYILKSKISLYDSTLNTTKYRLLYDTDRITELPYSEEELNSIIKLFENEQKNAVGYFYEKASKENFIKEISNYKYIHVASHSFVNPEQPQFSGIILHQSADSTISDESIILSNEIYNLDLNADLVVLSSCESGAGKLIKGEGIMALTRGFLYAGSNNILTSLWKVLDKSTSELMKSFYESVLSGKSYAASLREAKLNLIKNPQTAFPINWSGFILIGN